VLQTIPANSPSSTRGRPARESSLSHLAVLAYADEFRAAEVLAALWRLRTGGLVVAEHAVVVVRATNWSVTLHHRADLREADASARFWRALIASLVLAPCESTPRASPEEYGLGAAFVGSLGQALPPGSSAVFILLPRAAKKHVVPELRRFGGTLLETSIRPGAHA
jgi:uncharacterized membrane protein